MAASGDSPVAIVRRASWPDQETFRSTLGTVADLVERQQIRPPAVIIVGEVVATASQPSAERSPSP
jgi:precorrin-4 methylase